jgi:hypothetical protein
MSIRAHCVEEIKTNGESFNLWHDRPVVEWLLRNTSFFNSLNCDCCGLTEVSVEALERMLSEIGDKIDPLVKEAIERDIRLAIERGDEYATYYCY